MSDRLQNVLRILEGGASDRRRSTSLGLGPQSAGPPASAPIGVHRILGVEANAPAAPELAPEAEPPRARDSGPVPQPSPFGPDPEIEIREEEPSAEERGCGLALYAASDGVAIVAASVVETRPLGLPERLDPRLVLWTAPESAQARSFRLLAHRVRHSGDPRVILVTSPRRGEGKTTAAANLALAMAEDGAERVLLLEANARTQCHAQIFGLQSVAGLARQMARLETALVPWTAYEIQGTRLSVLPAEPGDAVIGRGLFAAALTDFRSAFDRVIVDAPSVLDSADVTALSDSVDGVVLCARTKQSRARELEKAARLLAPARVLGVTLLDVKEVDRS